MERKTTLLKYGWKFKVYPDGKCPDEVLLPEYNDSEWETVRVPHDWAVTGEFKLENDCSYREITADGINNPIEHSGRTGGLPIIGLGVYRTEIDIPEDAEALTLEFDGVMWEANVYINGTHAFFNHFGYKSFEVDIAPYVKKGEKAYICVTAAVYHDCSRWYPGAGIYRNVRFVEKSASHINFSGIWMRQLQVMDNKANFELSIDYTGSDKCTFTADIYAPNGEKAVSVEHGTYLGDMSAAVVIPSPVLWDIDSPNLYTAVISLKDENGIVTDTESKKFGIRTAEFTVDHGFFLNGRHVKLNGVCNHHDMGSLGAAVNVAALRRQLRFMKEMGVNSIRTSHNPPAPELLNLCDELGFVVMDEMFDEWYLPKVHSGYANYFRKHAKQDVIDTIKRDRNHPCVILWSIGNEIIEQGDVEGWRAAKMLSETCHATDPTRMTTAGFNGPHAAFENHLADYVDVVGLNYQPRNYMQFHKDHPNVRLIGTETASCVSSRGIYHLPAEVAIPAVKHDDLSVSNYELEGPGWAYYPEREWAAQDDCEFIAGEYVWTGMDYLGEPSPYYSEWPSRSSYFGIVDLAGTPKNRFYGYKAHWTNEKVLHIFPHWNWEGHEGETVPVHCYTSYPSAELFINGKSFGVRTFTDDNEISRYRLIWNNAVYEPGEITVAAYDENGVKADEKTIRTAGAPAKIVLSADRESIAADGDDLVYVTATITDADGNICPHADNRITFSVEGCAELLTTDSGDQRETESFARPDKKALSGICVACLRSIIDEKGRFTISAAADGLETGCVCVTAE